MDNITGKTPEQVGFEGIAEAVIGGWRTEGASLSAGVPYRSSGSSQRPLSECWNERVATSIWSAVDDQETLEEVPTFSLQKLEAMAMDALAVQAEMADDDASFEVAAAVGDVDVFNALMPTDECSESGGSAGRARWALGGGHLKDRYGKPERGGVYGS
jgi:hypothetical protein